MQLKFGTVATEPITLVEAKTYLKVDYAPMKIRSLICLFQAFANKSKRLQDSWHCCPHN